MGWAAGIMRHLVSSGVRWSSPDWVKVAPVCGQRQRLSARTPAGVRPVRPTRPGGRDTGDAGVVRHVRDDDRTRCDQRPSADRDRGDADGPGADRGAVADRDPTACQSAADFAEPSGVTARGLVVGEHGGRTDEDAGAELGRFVTRRSSGILQCGPMRTPVLTGAAPDDANPGRSGAPAHLRQVPDPRPVAQAGIGCDVGGVLDDSGGIGHSRSMVHAAPLPGQRSVGSSPAATVGMRDTLVSFRRRPWTGWVASRRCFRSGTVPTARSQRRRTSWRCTRTPHCWEWCWTARRSTRGSHVA